MTTDEFIALRRSLGLTQSDFARGLGISLRSLQEVEHGDRRLRHYLALAAERLALSVALERREPMLAPAAIRRDALQLVRDIQS